jgi:prevent-host-death family protein
MNMVSIAELKARLSEFIAAARQGEEIVVTDRGRPVARLTGLTGTEALDANALELVRSGLLRAPQRPLSPTFREAARGSDASGSVLRNLLDEREEGL